METKGEGSDEFVGKLEKCGSGWSPLVNAYGKVEGPSGYGSQLFTEKSGNFQDAK